MKIVEYSPEQFDSLEPFWKKLESGRDMTIFQTFTWYKWVNSAFFKEKIKNYFRKWIYFLCFDDDNNPIMIAPFQIVKIGFSFKGLGLNKGVYFIGRKGYSDYLNFIYNDFNQAAVDFILEHLKKYHKVKRCIFENTLEKTNFSLYIREKFKVEPMSKISCAALELPQSFDAYSSQLKKHAKQNLRTALNRQKRDKTNLNHQVVYEVDDSLQNALWSIRAQRLKDKEKKSIKKISSKIYNWVRNNFVVKFNAHINVFDCQNDQWCFLVKRGKKIVGFYWGIRDVDRKCYYVILAGVDKEYSWYSPSISHLYLWISEMYDKGNDAVKIIDFTVGDERYKTDIGGTIKYVEKYEFYI